MLSRSDISAVAAKFLHVISAAFIAPPAPVAWHGTGPGLSPAFDESDWYQCPLVFQSASMGRIAAGSFRDALFLLRLWNRLGAYFIGLNKAKPAWRGCRERI
jgi:hypothetical protein